MESVNSKEQVANLVMVSQIQPIFYVKTRLGYSPRRFKQAQAYFKVIAWKCGKGYRTSICLDFKVHNQTLKRKMNGIDMLRITLDDWMIKYYLQYQQVIHGRENESQPIGRAHSTIKKFIKYPRYDFMLRWARDNGKLAARRPNLRFNHQLLHDIKRIEGEVR